jgi:HD-GYP domain-containing protein (c-di-GMP phosphodiesterase class II)
MNKELFELEQNNLNLKVHQVHCRELIKLKIAPCQILTMNNGNYLPIIESQDTITKTKINQILTEYAGVIFIYSTDKYKLINEQEELLRYNLRYIHNGDPANKCALILENIAIHLNYAYQDPFNYNYSFLYQNIETFIPFLINNTNVHKNIYQLFLKQKHHFTIAQPIISSLFLSGILKQAEIISEKEIINLFITSLFKDIGISLVPKEIYEKENLDEKEVETFARHPQSSVDILKLKIPLEPNYFTIIKNHHLYSSLNNNQNIQLNDELIAGVETILVIITDIIAAMISERPYRAPSTIFKSLELIKELFSDQYPQEFRLLVLYFKQFFS